MKICVILVVIIVLIGTIIAAYLRYKDSMRYIWVHLATGGMVKVIGTDTIKLSSGETSIYIAYKSMVTNKLHIMRLSEFKDQFITLKECKKWKP